jgi:hypothetical protein
MTTFIVNGQEHEIEFYFNGMECSADFIGNTSHGMESDAEGRYIATREDLDWWQTTIAAHEAMETIIELYKSQFCEAEVNKVVQDWIDTDLDMMPDQVITGLNHAFGNMK